MEKISTDNQTECSTRYAVLRHQGLRSAVLFFNFFLIIMSLYLLKPASRSFIISTVGADDVPYVWIYTAITMIIAIPLYSKLVERVSRLRVVLGSCLVFIVLLSGFWFLLRTPGSLSAAAFFVFVDIYSVVLVEQFWSLADANYTTQEGKRWYGLVGTGGLLGGVAGGFIGGWLIDRMGLTSAQLLLAGAGTVMAIFILTGLMAVFGLYCENEPRSVQNPPAGGFRAIVSNSYLMTIAGILLLAQFASQFVEFQFLHTVQQTMAIQDDRTAYLSYFFMVLSSVAIGVNLVATPLVHKLFGAVAGLVVQPALMAVGTLVFMFHSTLAVVSATKISDRGLSYSINRASRELLYVPVSPVVIFQAKAWIDMFGYRMFKVLGAVVILAATRWLSVEIPLPKMGWFTLAACLVWALLILFIRKPYLRFSAQMPDLVPASKPT